MPLNPAIQHLLDTAMPEMEPLNLLPAADGQSWQFRYEAETFFTLHHDAESDTLSFLAAVGEPSDEVATSVYEKLLVFNNQWQHTGSLRFGLDQESDALLLIYDRPLALTTPAHLVDIATNLVEQRHVWRNFIQHAKDDTPPPEPASFNPGMMGGGIIRG